MLASIDRRLDRATPGDNRVGRVRGDFGVNNVAKDALTFGGVPAEAAVAERAFHFNIVAHNRIVRLCLKAALEFVHI
jgi:hypothetical protein